MSDSLPADRHFVANPGDIFDKVRYLAQYLLATDGPTSRFRTIHARFLADGGFASRRRESSDFRGPYSMCRSRDAYSCRRRRAIFRFASQGYLHQSDSRPGGLVCHPGILFHMYRPSPSVMLGIIPTPNIFLTLLVTSLYAVLERKNTLSLISLTLTSQRVALRFSKRLNYLAPYSR